MSMINETTSNTKGWILPIALIIPGLLAAAVQLIGGLDVIGVTKQITWGLYIAGFFTAAGVGSGLLLLTGLGEFTTVYPKAARNRVLSAVLSALAVAGLLISLDLGMPLRSWMFAVTFKLSMLGLDFWALISALVITVTYFLMTAKNSTNERSYKFLGLLSILSALFLLVVEGLMLATLASHPMWNALTVVNFLVSAFIGGSAIVAIQFVGTEAGIKARTWLTIGLGISLVFIIAEVLTGITSETPVDHHEAMSLLTGQVSIYFWGQLIVGLVLPLLALIFTDKSQFNPIIAILAIFGIFLDKIWVLIAGQQTPWLPIAEGTYTPTMVEIVVVATMTLLGVGVCKALVKFNVVENS